MILQIWSECKKVLRTRWIWVMFIGVLAFLMFTGSSYSISDYAQGYKEDGTSFSSQQEAITYEKELKRSFEGEMNAKWFARLEKEAKEARKTEVLMRADADKMQEAYGDNWADQYAQDPQRYVNAEYLNGDENFAEELPFYIKDNQEHVYLLKSVVLDSLEYNYASYVKDKLWTLRLDDEDEKMKIAHWSRELPAEEKAYVLQDINENPTFYYGETSGWQEVLNNFEGAYFIFPIFLVILCSNMFNKEHDSNMIELMKVTSYGKRKTAFAKVCACIFISILFTFLMVSWVLLYSYLRHGFGNWNVSLTEITNGAINPFTVKDAVIGGIRLITVGGFVVSLTSMFVSAVIKSKYISLIVSALLFILPTFSQASIMQLMPIKFMCVKSVFTSINMIDLFGIHYIMNAVWVWFPPLILLCGIAYAYYATYHFQKI